MIHVCYAIHDRTGHYCKFLGTSVHSLLKNTAARVAVHILCDGTLSPRDRDRLANMAGHFRQQIAFYDVSEAKGGGTVSRMMRHLSKAYEEHFSPASMYRLILWDVLPGDLRKAIYLDADTLVHMDISRLWNEPVGGNGLSAVVDSLVKVLPDKKSLDIFDRDRYFNSGVLLMERDRFVLPEWSEKVLWFIQHFPSAKYVDQDALNYYYGDRYRPLDARYNALVGYERYRQRRIVETCIYHYSGPANTFDFDDVYNQLFFQHFTETSWCNAEFLQRMWSVAQGMQRSCTEALQRALRALPGRKRVAFADEEDRGKISAILQLQPDEACIAYRDGLSIDFAALEEMRGSAVFLLFGESYEAFKPAFLANGYEERVDFFEGDGFLLPEEGGLLMDTHSIFCQL